MSRTFTPPKLEPGRVYRTKDLRRFSTNPVRLAERLVADGALERLGYGLYHQPREGRLGPRPPDDEELLRAFLGSNDWLFSGPSYWNSLRLGTTAMFAHALVYNRARTGKLVVGRRTFLFRRVRFPKNPSREWYLVDLLNNAGTVDASLEDLVARLPERFASGELDERAFGALAEEYGTRTIKTCLRAAALL